MLAALTVENRFGVEGRLEGVQSDGSLFAVVSILMLIPLVVILLELASILQMRLFESINVQCMCLCVCQFLILHCNNRVIIICCCLTVQYVSHYWVLSCMCDNVNHLNGKVKIQVRDFSNGSSDVHFGPLGPWRPGGFKFFQQTAANEKPLAFPGLDNYEKRLITSIRVHAPSPLIFMIIVIQYNARFYSLCIQ